MTRHLSQIGLTLGLTFTDLSLLVAVDDATAGEVVRGKLHDDPVLGEDADVVLPHLAADVGQDLVAVLQLHAEHRVGERLDDSALDLDGPVLLRHVLASPSWLVVQNDLQPTGSAWETEGMLRLAGHRPTCHRTSCRRGPSNGGP